MATQIQQLYTMVSYNNDPISSSSTGNDNKSVKLNKIETTTIPVLKGRHQSSRINQNNHKQAKKDIVFKKLDTFL